MSYITPGKVYLVGAGPGDPGLMTLRGKTLLEHANVVVYDALVSPAILSMIGAQAVQIYGGKRSGRHSAPQAEITQQLIQLAQEHAVVVRLKGGDPFMFGRGGEEMADLIAAGVPVEVVPGVTSGIAAPAYAGIPLTHRDYSSSVAFITGHEAVDKYRPSVNWQALAKGAETLVVYMGVQNLGRIVEELLQAGRSPDTPVALVRWGTLPEQTELFATLATVVTQIQVQDFQPPAVAVIGEVVNLRQHLKP
ncbi:uroporphyrinogen-III C-methyltransferase [Leptolyngbya sp. FACHB-261]|uniref:uroporphyrinogen-III C-methyltransferase n=1 Tax=Leptolyngbya sp. FACHB-261 TaxID=2692806 RepID=UPI001683C380|nr:uroporphyrinogen-III C-methyltransferase [Leptolyngbya sp. FACHB-261]MBD2101868.1 uroporphyrinogen-III C-methyltransferase [Leptolyngbya sp. FACHB-261]